MSVKDLRRSNRLVGFGQQFYKLDNNFTMYTCGYVNQKIVVALAETIKLMQLIDAAIPSFPIE